VYSCMAFSFIRCRTVGQNVPFCGGSIFVAFVCWVVVRMWLFCAAPLRTARASRAFVFISSSRSLLVQNHISSGVVFRM